MRVGLVDYGSGNLGSVRNALACIEATPELVRRPEDLRDVSHIVLPGVGAFDRAMTRLRELELVDALREAVTSGGRAFLGICVGMQILADRGYEFTPCDGLGLIGGEVRRLRVPGGERLPHIGWNTLRVERACALLAGLEEPTFYFVHSYNFEVAEPADCVATCDYGAGVCAVVARGNIFGVQFHPEKSQRDGLQLLRNFVALAA